MSPRVMCAHAHTINRIHENAPLLQRRVFGQRHFGPARRPQARFRASPLDQLANRPQSQWLTLTRPKCKRVRRCHTEPVRKAMEQSFSCFAREVIGDRSLAHGSLVRTLADRQRRINSRPESSPARRKSGQSHVSQFAQGER
ncbi:MAG: hypothetical protein [Cressdnaviricota sp.]|nr:MAG: hypothetical protein [Cressdnaviricota sp.]